LEAQASSGPGGQQIGRPSSVPKGCFAIIDRPLPTTHHQPLTTGIVFENVHFAYLPGQPVLRGASFTVPAGQVTALVGPSGAGKSTLLNLLLRFIEPEAGALWVDGQPLATIEPAAWRERLAWVPQRPHLFHATLGQNMTLGQPGATRAELDRAARQAQLLDFVASLPAGYDTLVGERGTTLSGGQAQRVALARAFLRPAPLLLLDEPTAHLDPGLDARLRAATAALIGHAGSAGQRTLLVIAHRVSTALAAQQVVVLEAGQVVEAGPPAALARSGGAFARLVALGEGTQ
jgi:ATP-binding cassette subfamily C protein CydD